MAAANLAPNRPSLVDCCGKKKWGDAFNMLRMASSSEERKQLVSQVGKHGITPAYWAARYGQDEILLLILEAGGDPGAPNNRGWTALHHAAMFGYVKCARMLLKYGGNAEARDSKDASPKDVAREYGRIEVLLTLDAPAVRVRILVLLHLLRLGRACPKGQPAESCPCPCPLHDSTPPSTGEC